MATDNEIEAEIRAKGLTAPRVTLDSIEAKIQGEFYFTALDGVDSAHETDWNAMKAEDSDRLGEILSLLTFCVLVLENGFTVTGQSAVASAANFDPEIGRKIARADAFNKIWPLEGYLLRNQLHEAEGR